MRKAEELLNENPLTDEIIRQAANLAQEEANPRDSVMRASREYRLQLIPTLVSEALHQAAQRATAKS
jgi:carbon-monoxide dehydrogenase medium subunit